MEKLKVDGVDIGSKFVIDDEPQRDYSITSDYYTWVEVNINNRKAYLDNVASIDIDMIFDKSILHNEILYMTNPVGIYNNKTVECKSTEASFYEIKDLLKSYKLLYSISKFRQKNGTDLSTKWTIRGLTFEDVYGQD